MSLKLPSSFLLFVEILLSVTLGSLTILPGIIFLYLLNKIVRFFVSMLLWLNHGDEINLNPTGYDGMYMYEGHKHGKRMILYVAIQEDPIDIKSHQQSYRNHVVSLPQYQKLKKIWTRRLGYFCLKDDTAFCIKKHVRFYPGLGDDDSGVVDKSKIVTETQLLSEILPALSNDMEETHPQWEDVIIPQFQYDNPLSTSLSLSDPMSASSSIRSARIFRVHHGYMDGLSTMLMLAYTQSEGKSFPWIVDPLSPKRRPVLSTFLFYLFCSLTFSSQVARNLLNPPSSTKSRWNVRNFSGESLYSWSKPISMSLLKEIKTQSGSSMPAILCSILASSLRKLEESFESNDPEFRGHISEELLIGLVAALLPHPDLELRNHHCMVKCYLNSKEMSRIERLRTVNEEMNRLSRSPELHLNFVMPQLYGGMPGWFSDMCTALIGGCGVVSNFPAASRKVRFWGNEVREMVGWVPLLTSVGFACVTLRYADYLRFCLNADKASLSKDQLDFLVTTIVEEAELLARDCSTQKKLQETTVVSKFVKNRDVNDNSKNISYEVMADRRLQRALDRVTNTVKKLKNA